MANDSLANWASQILAVTFLKSISSPSFDNFGIKGFINT